MAFHEVVFPESLAYGFTGGPMFSTDVVTLSSGAEKRNINWSIGRARWRLESRLHTEADFTELLDFFRARRGRGHGFLFKDQMDYCVTGVHCGIGDGSQATFQCVKEYPGTQTSGQLAIDTVYTVRHAGTSANFSNVGGGNPPSQNDTFTATGVTPTAWGSPAAQLVADFNESRTIKKVKDGTLSFYVDGATQTEGGGADYTMDYQTGIVTFNGGSEPGNGTIVTADFEFYVPARFETDQMPATWESYLRKSWPDVGIVELLL